MLFSNADEGWKEHMKQVQETFPDGTPIQDWFYQDSAPSLEELGRVYWLTDHHIEAGDALQTARIQALIDAIHQQGGGVLAVPEGTFRTGALFFRPHVHLYLAPGSMLLGSDDIADYPVLDTRIEGESCAYFSALINADRCDGFTVLGSGVIDGNGMKSWKAFWLRRTWNPQCTNKDEQRPRLLYVSNSKNVTVSGVRMQNSAFWTSHYYRCDHLRILDCSFYSPFEPVRSPSTDAIDLDHVRGEIEFKDVWFSYIPGEWVLDAVNCSLKDSWYQNPWPAAFDAGWTYCGAYDGDPDRFGKSVRRKEVNGKLADTNVSTNDFTPNATPSLK